MKRIDTFTTVSTIPTRLTFEEMCAAEPELAELHNIARAVRDDGRPSGFCANQVWSCSLKPTLLRLVGWGADKEALQSSDAYDRAYETIYDCLPPCRVCGCL